MKRLWVILALSAAMFLGACAGKTMNRIMSSWEGAHIDEVISQWGYPDGERSVAGKRIYVWNRNQTYSMPETSSSTVNVIGNTAYVNTSTYGGGTLRGSCQRIVEVNSENRVAGWQWKGNNCPVLDVAFGYQNWERRSSAGQNADDERHHDSTSSKN